MLTKVIEQAKIDRFTKWFERADKIVIVSHVSPDGDAIGSSLGLYHFLNSQEKTVNVIVPNAFPDFLRWMPGSKDILLYDRYKDFADKLIAEADVICCLDFNALKRIDEMADAVAASPARKVMIDHHLYPEEFCKITMSYPKISSTSELIFRLICRMGYFSDISKEGAECIYTGMMTDTGGFTYNSNNREIYFIISVRRFVRYEGVCSAYVHGGGTHGILVNFETTNGIEAKDEFVAYGKDIAMQVAAANPGYVDEASVPAEVVAKEKEILLAQMANDPKNANKPDAVKQKMIEGKIKKYFKENCLVDQEFVKDGDLTVAQ